MTVAASILHELNDAASPEKEAVLRRFFKAGPGEYGEGDRFLGVMVPRIRAIARSNLEFASASDVRTLLSSPLHEARECGLLLLVGQFRAAAPTERLGFHLAYLDAVWKGRVNNWDLVDCSAPTLVGEFLLDSPPNSLCKGTRLLDSLLCGESLWENRVAVVSMLAFIRRGELDEPFRICESALAHPHDLMHKAVGWMLRECGKRDPRRLRSFLSGHATSMPRTALRYAIERFPAGERKKWLSIPREPRQ